jgi:hypothetical protein
MAIQIRRITPGSSEVSDFMKVPHRIYRDDPNWVAPLNIEFKERLDPKTNPFFEHAEAIYFVAERDGELVGRVTAQIDHEHQKRYADAAGFFGFLDTVEDPTVCAALLDAAAAWLRERGMKTIRGPLSLSINEELGVLVEGFDTPPSIMMPHHRPYQAGLIEAAGFAKLKDFYAWFYTTGEVPARARRAHEQIFAEPGLAIRTVDMSKMDRDVRIITDIFNDAWSQNWGFVPATENEIKKMAKDLKLILNPQLGLIAEVNGEPAAVSIALPNVNEVIADLHGKLFPYGLPIGLVKMLWRLKVKKPRSGRLLILGIKKQYRVQKKWMPLSVALYVEMNNRARALGMTHGELSWTLEDNGPVNAGIRAMGGKVYKRYRVYEKPLQQP